LEGRIEAFVCAQDNGGDDRSALTFRAEGDGAGDRTPQIVRDPLQAAAAADLAVPACAQDYMHALPTQVGRLVERAVRLSWTRTPHGRDQLQDGALWGRAARRELESRPLVDLQAAEAAHPDRNPDAELTPPRRARHLGDDRVCFPDPTGQDAPV